GCLFSCLHTTNLSSYPLWDVPEMFYYRYYIVIILFGLIPLIPSPKDKGLPPIANPNFIFYHITFISLLNIFADSL
ncbi:MAG TPA: hypothetical protein VFD56_05230, partial [Chitinophagaceae bacterium]|nr:hypothetical protein [Chitinophagaceae bacterium]